MIKLVPAHLEAAYEQIHAAARNAEIIVTGYPRLFPENSTSSCTVGLKLSLTAAVQNWLNQVGDSLNRAVSTAVADVRGKGVNIHFVDPTSAFSGHAVCSAQPWIYGLVGTLPVGKLRVVSPASFHPNQTGQAEYAKLVSGCLDRSASC